MIAHDRGLVLRTFALRETSKIVCLLSREHGKLRLVARGVRAPNSRAGANLEVGNELDFVFSQKPGRDLGHLRETSLVHPWLTEAGRLEVLGLGWAVLELLERVLPESGPEGGHHGPEGAILMDLLEYLPALHQSATRADALLLFYSFELQLLERLGLQPDLGACRTCGAAASGVFWLDVEAATCTCRHCRVATPLELEVPAAAVQILQALLQHPWRSESLGSLAATRRAVGLVLHRLLARHLERYRYPRSLRLLRSVEMPDEAAGVSRPSRIPELEILKTTPGKRA